MTFTNAPKALCRRKDDLSYGALMILQWEKRPKSKGDVLVGKKVKVDIFAGRVLEFNTEKSWK
jgi:hypothetical protein